jgi:uncharacterized protein YcfJ
MKRIVTVTAAAAIALTASMSAQAGGHRHSDADTYYVWAKVVDVEPIVHLVQVSTPKRVCWDERVRHVDHGGYRDRSTTPVVVGGIIGGVLGNRIVDGRARGVATVAGALLGASVGNDYARSQHRPGPSRSYVTTERRCEIEQIVREEERIDGYRVTYKYKGRRFVTRSPHEPGERIRVRVQVEPVAYGGVEGSYY